MAHSLLNLIFFLSGIKNGTGTEEFYPNEAKPLMETYVDLVTKLSNQ
jgi:hypothetical protein